MAGRSEYTENRRRNLVESDEGALELRNALVAIPAPERARLLSENPTLLARIPSPELRADVLLAGAELPPGTELVVRQEMARSDEKHGLPAIVSAALVPTKLSSMPTGVPVDQQHVARQGKSHLIKPRHRIGNKWFRTWDEFGRIGQAASLALVVTLGVDGWYAAIAAASADALPATATFQFAGTWPSCSEGLRPQTDYCVYSVRATLDWVHAMEDLHASDTEEAAMRSVNKPLIENNTPWPPATLLVVWRGLIPENHK